MNARIVFVTALLIACAHGDRPTAPPLVLGSSTAVSPTMPPPADAVRASALLSAPTPSPGASPAPVVSAPDTSPAPEIANRGGLRGLVSALNDVDRIELLRWDRPAPPVSLSPEDHDRLLKLVRQGHLIDAHTLAHPPWLAAFLFHTRKHGAYAVTLVGPSNLRLDPGSRGRFTGDAARWNDSPPPEMALADEDDWVWEYLESRLGKTREKEYLAPKAAPDYLELPHKP